MTSHRPAGGRRSPRPDLASACTVLPCRSRLPLEDWRMTEFFMLSTLGFVLFVAVKFVTLRPVEDDSADEVQGR